MYPALLLVSALVVQTCAPSLRGSCGGFVLTGRVQTNPPTTARLTLAVDRTDSTRSYRFLAEIVGGPDDDQSLYCVPMTWDFGDGPALSVSPSCAPWAPGTKIQRRFEISHVYESSGRYGVSFTYGPLTAKQIVDVQ